MVLGLFTFVIQAAPYFGAVFPRSKRERSHAAWQLGRVVLLTLAAAVCAGAIAQTATATAATAASVDAAATEVFTGPEVTAAEVLSNPVVRAEIEAAWVAAGFGTDNPHEEGGWIYRSVGRQGHVSYIVKRWPAGPTCTTASGCGITPQSPVDIPGFELVAEFHIHPMPEYDAHGRATGFAAEPSRADLKAAQDQKLLGIVRNQYGYNPYNGYGCGPSDGCGGDMLALSVPDALQPMPVAAGDRASSYQGTRQSEVTASELASRYGVPTLSR